MDPLELALESLKSLEIGEKPNYTQVAKKYGVRRDQLARHHRGVQGTHAEKCENQRLLNSTQETALIQYIDGLCKKGLPPSSQMIRNFASEIAGREAGKTWVTRFLHRHNIDLIS